MTVSTSPDLLAGVAEAVDALRCGQMVIVVDDADRENEGDFVLAAEFVSPQAINFMATFGRGLICVPMLTETLDALDIPPAVANNTDSKQTAFRVSVDHARLTTTGISAKDRANTILALTDPGSKTNGFHPPGTCIPAWLQPRRCARETRPYRGGRRPRCTGRPDTGRSDLRKSVVRTVKWPGYRNWWKLAGSTDCPVLRIADLITYRQRELSRVTRAGEARLPLAAGVFRVIGFVDGAGREHIALVKGGPQFQFGSIGQYPRREPGGRRVRFGSRPFGVRARANR